MEFLSLRRRSALGLLSLFAAGSLWLMGTNPVQGDDPVITGTAVHILGDELPEPPQGFRTSQEVLAKLAAGNIPIVNLLQSYPEVTVERDVVYGQGGEHALKLDLYSPARTDKPVPGLIFIHGGGWKAGHKEDYRLYGYTFASKGFVVATISYRLSGLAQFPAQVEDAKCAVRWMRANSEKLHVDPQHIGVAGGSAGGHLALMVGLSPNEPDLEGNGGYPGVSSRVQCVADLYGPTDLTTDFARRVSTEGSLLHQFLGKTLQQDEPLYRRASPLTYLTQAAPPILIMHGTIDDIVPVDQSDRLAKQLAALEIPYIYDRLPGWPHAMDASRDVNARCVWLMEKFFDHYLRQPPASNGERP